MSLTDISLFEYLYTISCNHTTLAMFFTKETITFDLTRWRDKKSNLSAKKNVVAHPILPS